MIYDDKNCSLLSNNLKTARYEVSNTLELTYCPLCKSGDLQNDFIHEGFQVQSCPSCHLKMLNPQPSDQTLAAIYSADYFLTGYTPGAEQKVSELKRATARLYLDMAEEYGTRSGSKLLEIGSGLGDLLVEAQARGFEVTGIEYSKHAVETAQARLNSWAGRHKSNQGPAQGPAQVICGEVEQTNLPEASFDICIMADVLEHTRQPERFMKAVHRLLKPGGIILITVPSLDSWSAKLLGQNWMEYKTEHLYYFNKATLETLLFLTNFNRVLTRPSPKILSAGYVFAHFDRYPIPMITPVTRLASRLLPKTLLDRHVKLVASGLVVIARKQEIEIAPRLWETTVGVGGYGSTTVGDGSARRFKLSVIMPVFNERKTFSQVMELLVQKEIDGLEMEIVVVESNSTDGTREEVLKYKDHPKVKLILEDKPQGKGHAVRTGLAHAAGDFILIQDADLEYDLNDYEELLAPLRAGTSAFVLGSRHGQPTGYNRTASRSAWKIRHFIDQPEMGLLLNFGHIFFTTALNVLYGQRTKDPFTMYKVFRRDCLFGLNFECNRFDFDFELVIKLWRKGYKALEIPVSYNSRSFNEGKKVTILRDPLTWLRALARYRLQPLNLVKNVREANLAELASDRSGEEISEILTAVFLDSEIEWEV